MNIHITICRYSILEYDNFWDVNILLILEINFDPMKIEYFFVFVLILDGLN